MPSLPCPSGQNEELGLPLTELQSWGRRGPWGALSFRVKKKLSLSLPGIPVTPCTGRPFSVLGVGCLMIPSSLSDPSCQGSDHLFDPGAQRGSWSREVTLGARNGAPDLEVAASAPLLPSCLFLNSLLPSPEEAEQPYGLALIAGAWGGGGGGHARLGHQLPLTTHTAKTLP